MKKVLLLLGVTLAFNLFASEPFVSCKHATGENDLNLVKMELLKTGSDNQYSSQIEIILTYADNSQDIFKGKLHKDDLTDAIRTEQIIMTSQYLVVSSKPENPTQFVTLTIMDGAAGIATQRERGDLNIIDQGIKCIWNK